MADISFPGLGIDWFTLNSTAFTIFGKPVQWYGIIIATAMVLAFFYTRSRGKIEGVKTDDLIDYALFLMIFGVLGARLYYVIFTPGYIATGGSVASNIWHTFVNIISIWNGGLAIFGGIIAGFLTVVIVSKKKKIHIPVILDMIAPALIMAQGIGRWGNFFNAEAYGGATTLPWRMGIVKGVSVMINDPDYAYKVQYVHPTFLYESIWCLIGFAIIHFLYKKKKFNGQNFCYYMIWYGLGRAIIEGLRTDSLYVWHTPLRVSQLVAILLCLGGVVLLVMNLMKVAKKNKPIAETPVDAPVSETVEETTEEKAEEKAEEAEAEEEKESEEKSETDEKTEG